MERLTDVVGAPGGAPCPVEINRTMGIRWLNRFHNFPRSIRLGRPAGRFYNVPVIFIVCLFIRGLVYADVSQDLFKQGNDAYAAGKFADAITAYESGQKQGLRSWALSYNLGNAYYRSGQTGKAIVNYDRAFQLNPGRGDVVYNLNLAATKAGDPRVPSSALPALFWRLFYFFSANTLALMASLVLTLLAAGLIAWFLGKWSPRTDLLGLLGVLLGLLAIWLGVRIYLLEQPVAIVVVPTAEVRSGPNLSETANFIVPEGRRVLILEEQEPVSGWVEIGVPQEGLKGWVPDTAVESI
jgi:hypothetical protein